MRIHCKQCGKEYRVNEQYLTEEGIRAKCRQCGAILRIRLRKKGTPGEGADLPDVPPRVPAAPASPYRYCIACGDPLEGEVSPDGRPLCSACELLEGVVKESPAFGSGGKRSHSRHLLYTLVFVVLLFSAFLGYRLALL